MHICTVTVQCVNNFLFFFLSPLSNCNKLARQRRRISKRQCQCHHQTTTNPTTIPSAITKHRNLAQKHIPKSTETQKSTQPKINRNPKINLTQNQQNPKINPTQNQLKLTGKPNPKTVHTHRKTQPNGAESATRSAATGSSIAAAESSIATVGWRWEAKGRLWRRDGGQK